MEITGQTKLMFVLAHPIGHVRATAILNAHFQSIGRNVAASPLHVAPEDLETVIGAIRKMRNVIGFGTTIPHKIPVMRHLDELTPNARNVGAVNFTRRDEDDRLIGHNTDGLGFVAGLKANGVDPVGKRVLQIGAGGAGRAVAFALAEAGASALRIINRDVGKAADLARNIVALYPDCDATAGPEKAEDFDIVVNTTSVGMKEDDPIPIDLGRTGPATVVADVIMSPPVTRLLAKAAERGCKTIGGKVMPDEQMGLVTAFLHV
ncbi:shikimate dehydrogenase family protein [Mesorhizobium sp. IMUNJ 23232]|uniref:shikimate dehydrogenase family protein n=1 Tax=Mesorhizobium sp. IMUNJ 23232 TaxID=3376064 RepID=UPI00379DB400